MFGYETAKKYIGKAVSVGKVLGGGGIKRLQGLHELFSEIPFIEDFVGESKALLKQYADKVITAIDVCRKPLSGALQKVINTLGGQPLANLKSKMGVDDLFHLYMRVHLQGAPTLQVEKNEKPQIGLKIEPAKKEETRIVPVSPGLTFGEMITNGIKKATPSKYFVYNPFYANCQDFITINLSASPQIHLTPETRSWINQNASEIAKTLPDWAKSFGASAIHDISKLTGQFGINLVQP